ncbi:endo-1,4-beta-xylanase [Mucilaginibacter auburnensis]|uniref:Beta-xylanase n=1 Tax=Mucilaginibacter auburnensis TaxID=1457233 RepID=A0A2H9VU70_9SPHI|nr:endo-1,4-beta-xylanase [Mucilaginibacter auburnensis]PJJ84355.1 endo-1,4-beta-xylanase [Mucilaginibacter auburnensis]
MNKLKKLLTVCIAACCLADTAPVMAQALKDVYKDAFVVGAAITPFITQPRSKQMLDTLLKHFNAVTIENDMKPERINPRPGEYNWTGADQYVEFGEKNKMFIVAHTLVWHNQTPDFFFTNAEGKPNTKAQQLERMRSHIEAVAGRYKGRVHAWDVVNEIIGEDGNYRPTNWNNIVGSGDTVVKYAFKYAQQYAPNTELYYNDFNMWRPEKRDAVVRMVKMLQKEGIRIDGVGMQGHWGLNYPENKYIEDAINAYSALGVKVMITELDIDVLPVTKEAQVTGKLFEDKQFQLPEFKKFLDPYRDGLPDDVQAQLTKRYEELFDIFYRHRDQIARVTFWGMQDGQNWKNNYPVPRRINYPLIWDRQWNQKPALKAILKIPKKVGSAKATPPTGSKKF